MASRTRAHPENRPGDFFVDDTCIDCDLCRELAPTVFADAGGHSYVHAQPGDAGIRRLAARAALSCPTTSIGADLGVAEAVADFPLPVDGPVHFCGFSSRASFGARSWFVQRADGNWLIDAPRWVPSLAEAFARMGGIAKVFLTHQDDVADADRYAGRFAAEVIIHRRDRHAAPTATTILEGEDAATLAPGCVAIPVPGHTAGSCALLIDDTWLFTGDHLWWEPAEARLGASRMHCWHSWSEQIASMRRLLDHRFRAVLPGHGDWFASTPERMRAQLADLVERMQR
ncbi:MAG: MBL fold metallo-hydrolase [Planctomycetes bacterium]|nr:MBL fold metallo-hydrolase [Planctomycetota bacterium]